jgi:NAD kinase
MRRLTENKIVLVVRQTRLDELIARFNTEAQARFYIEHLGADFGDYLQEDRTYKAAVAAAENLLSALGRLQTLDRRYLPNFLFGGQDTVVVLGQDGLVANVLKYLDGQPVLGVNPDPGRWEGVLLPFRLPTLETAVIEVFKKQRPLRGVTIAEARLNTGETLYGVNDLFIGARSHASARYAIESGGRRENHSSSGIIVSTGLGSTGWFRSIVSGAVGIAAALAEKPLAIDTKRAFAWDAEHLFFSVREPWPSTTSSAGITFGKITAASPLTVTSQMPENGVIFSDGIEADFLRFDSGTRATIGIADKKGRLAV